LYYTFQFSVVFDKLPYLLGGAVISLEIAVLAFGLGAVIGLF
jgi:polar amino acid transport system permease protein